MDPLRCVLDLPSRRDFQKRSSSSLSWESVEEKKYWEVLDEVRSWWEEALHIVPTTVPDATKKTMYSFWYSMHQNVTAKNVEEESRRAAQLGLSAGHRRRWLAD